MGVTAGREMSKRARARKKMQSLGVRVKIALDERARKREGTTHEHANKRNKSHGPDPYHWHNPEAHPTSHTPKHAPHPSTLEPKPWSPKLNPGAQN